MAGLFLFADGGANAAVKYGGKPPYFSYIFRLRRKVISRPRRGYVRGKAAGYVLHPFWVQSLGVPAVRAHFEGVEPPR